MYIYIHWCVYIYTLVHMYIYIDKYIYIYMYIVMCIVILYIYSDNIYICTVGEKKDKLEKIRFAV